MESILEIISTYIEDDLELTHVTLCGDQVSPRLAISFTDGHVESHNLEKMTDEQFSNLNRGLTALGKIEWQDRTETIEVPA